MGIARRVRDRPPRPPRPPIVTDAPFRPLLRLESSLLGPNAPQSEPSPIEFARTMYLLKPYLAVFGALLLAASYFMVFKTDEAIIFYLGVLSATTEQAGPWLKSFNVEKGRSVMWQSPIYPLTIHLVKASGTVVFCLGLILFASVNFGSSRRFTEGACLLAGMVVYVAFAFNLALLLASLVVNRMVSATPKPKKKKT